MSAEGSVSLATPELVHVWHRCHACNAQPIRGTRFDCQDCPVGPESTFCERCYVSFTHGSVPHPAPGSFAEAMEDGTREVHEFRPFEGVRLADCSSWLAVPASSANAAPIVKDVFVVRPEFCMGRRSFFGSYAFAVATNPTLVLTALHTMSALVQSAGVDCSAGNSSYSGRELPALVTRVNLYDVFARNWMTTDLGTAGGMLPLAGARIGDEEPFSSRDIAAFKIERQGRLAPEVLAPDAPRVGDPLWLVVATERNGTTRGLPAVVVEATDRTLVFRHLGSLDVPLYTSGAPLLDGQGRVVGINVGGGLLNGARLGHANHVGNIWRHLETAGVTV